MRKHQGGNGITKLDTPVVVEVAETPLALGAEHLGDDQEAAYGIDQRLADGQYVAIEQWLAVAGAGRGAVEQWLAEEQWLPGQWLAEEQPPQPPHDYRGWQPGSWHEYSWQDDSWHEYSWQDDSWQNSS